MPSMNPTAFPFLKLDDLRARLPRVAEHRVGNLRGIGVHRAEVLVNSGQRSGDAGFHPLDALLVDGCEVRFGESIAGETKNGAQQEDSNPHVPYFKTAENQKPVKPGTVHSNTISTWWRPVRRVARNGVSSVLSRVFGYYCFTGGMSYR